jgi:hypothetical protein
LGLSTDPFVLVQQVTQNDHGHESTATVQEFYDSDANPGGPEFNTATRDPVGRFEAKTNGTYRLEVRDLFGRLQSNPRYVYRLSLRKEFPDFRLVALPQAPPPVNRDAKEAQLWTSFLRRGETIPVKVLALRHDNFSGAIELSVEGLPNGVQFTPALIETNQNSRLLFLTATEQADGWFGPIQVVGKSRAGDTSLSRHARAASVNWTVADYNNEPIRSRRTRDFYLSVSGVESAPVTLETAETKVWEAPAGARLQIPLKVTRRGEFNETLKLKATGVSGLDSLKELDIDSKTNAAVFEIDLAQQKLPPGAYTFHLQTQTKGKYRNNPEAATQAAEELKQAEQQLAELMAEARKAEEALTAATSAAEEAESSAKAAAERLAAAKVAADKTPTDEELVLTSQSAEKEAETSSERAKEAAAAMAAAVQATDEAFAKVKQAEAKKAAAAERAKQASQKAQPKDVTVTIYSPPITIRVIAEEKK